MNVYVDLPVRIKSPLDMRIASRFKVFDFYGNYMVANENLPTVMRWLGCVPSPRDTAEVIKKCELSELPGGVHFSRFLPVFIEMLEQGRMRPIEAQRLVDAFKFIDPLGKRFISPEDMEEKVANGLPDPFSEPEKVELLRVAIEQPANVCRYEKFLYKLLYRPEDCIYKLAAAEKVARELEPEG